MKDGMGRGENAKEENLDSVSLALLRQLKDIRNLLEESDRAELKEPNTNVPTPRPLTPEMVVIEIRGRLSECLKVASAIETRVNRLRDVLG